MAKATTCGAGTFSQPGENRGQSALSRSPVPLLARASDVRGPGVPLELDFDHRLKACPTLGALKAQADQVRCLGGHSGGHQARLSCPAARSESGNLTLRAP